MGKKALIRLLILLLLVGGIAAGVKFLGKGGGVSQVANSTTKKKVFQNFPLNDVTSITLKNGDSALNLKKGEKTWEVGERDGYPANNANVTALLKSVWDLDINQIVPVARNQFGRVGLLDPAGEEGGEGEKASVLTFFDENQKELGSLWLGKVYEKSEGRPNPFGGMAKSDAGRYVKRSGSNAVFLVGETFGDAETEPSTWLNEDFFEVEKIKTIAIKSGKAEEDWKLTRSEATGDYSLAEKKEGENELDQTKVSSMKTALSSPRFEDVLTGDALKDQKTDQTTFEITTFDGFSYQVSVGEKNDLNELPMTLKVSAKLVETRKASEDESEEDKKSRDEEFAENLKKLQEKLAKEKALEGHVYKIRSYLVDSITKKRSELLKEDEKKEEESADAAGGPATQEVAPGINIPLPQAKPNLPAAPPAPAPAPSAGKGKDKAGKE